MRDLTTERLKLNLIALQKAGALEYGSSVGWRWGERAQIGIRSYGSAIELRYTLLHDGSEHVDRIKLASVPCHYGGERLYFRCPHCGRRCLHLYGSAPFACRTCHDLAYQSETVKGAYRLYDTGQKIAHELAGRFVTLDEPFPDRPHGMHRKTYARLKDKWARMTAPARAMFDAMWLDDAFLQECEKRAVERERELQARAARTAAFHERYWQDKETPANGLRLESGGG